MSSLFLCSRSNYITISRCLLQSLDLYFLSTYWYGSLYCLFACRAHANNTYLLLKRITVQSAPQPDNHPSKQPPASRRSPFQPISQQASQPISQSISQSVSQSVSKSVNQSISQPSAICLFFCPPVGIFVLKALEGFFGVFLSMYVIQHCFVCRPSDSTVSEDAGDRTQDCCDFGIDSQTL